MKKIQVILLMILGTVSFAQCKENEYPAGDNNDTDDKSMFTNPVWNGADPWMVKKDNYYVYCRSVNTPAHSIAVHKSTKLTSLGEKKVIWSAPATGWNRSCIWAPEIHFIQGHWYVYVAAGESGPPFIHQRTMVLRSKTDDVFSEYEDMGQLYTGDTPEIANSNIWAIDMTVLEHKGKLYAIWSGWKKQEETDKTSQHLYICEMENPYTLKGTRKLLSSPVERWETGGPLDLNEGPQILKNGDKVFVVYSCRESWLVEYRLGMLELINPDGDITNRANWRKSGPVFQGTDQVLGVGHCSFVKSPDGTEDWIIYHSKKTKDPGWDRDVRMQPFTWNANGTPNFGKPIPAGQKIKLPAGQSK